MKKAVSASIMKKSDLASAEKIIGGTRELMRRAGEALARHVTNDRSPRRVAVVCGIGGNGGDGYAAALYLNDAGVYCKLYLFDHRFSPDGEYFWQKCRERGIPYEPITNDTLFSDFDTILDCIFGVGFRGTPNELTTSVIEKINSSSAFVVSADINSGLGGDSGTGTAVIRSDLTVAIGAYKYGHILGMAKDVIGSLALEDIGITVTDHHAAWAESFDFLSVFPPRKNHSHKGTYGTAAVLGGCREYSGAVKLANLSMSALRSGAGLSRLIVPDSIANGVMPYILESTLFTLKDDGGHIIYNTDELDKALFRVTSLAVGMGWGASDENIKILRHISENYSIPLVIDADGINAVAAYGCDMLKSTRCRVILTPHPAEFSRLSGESVKDILSDPVGYAEAFAKEYNVILLLKGTSAVVTDGAETVIVSRGSAGMAKGGSGDVLSGVLAGILAHSPASVLSVSAAAHICGIAGELAALKLGEISAVASDTVRHIPDAIREITSQNST